MLVQLIWIYSASGYLMRERWSLNSICLFVIVLSNGPQVYMAVCPVMSVVVFHMAHGIVSHTGSVCDASLPRKASFGSGRKTMMTFSSLKWLKLHLGVHSSALLNIPLNCQVFPVHFGALMRRDWGWQQKAAGGRSAEEKQPEYSLSPVYLACSSLPTHQVNLIWPLILRCSPQGPWTLLPFWHGAGPPLSALPRTCTPLFDTGPMGLLEKL